MAAEPTNIPLCDILAHYNALRLELEAAVLRVLASGQVINGPEVAEFETEAAAYCGAKHGIGCASGTEALLLALAGLNIGPGDEVIIPPFTFFATLGSVLRIGAKPVFVDIDPLTYNLDPTLLEAALTPRTKAIIPVHLFGQCAEMQAIHEIAQGERLAVIEDAAQSFGAKYNDIPCGTLGEVACFSFYPSKNLGTSGDAGLVTTNDDDLAAHIRALRNHGSEVKYYHKYVGWNSRLDAVQAALLRVKLPHVDAWLEGRRAVAERYDTLIEAHNLHGVIQRPVTAPRCTHTYNQYVIRVPANLRDDLVHHLREQKIGCEIYYPLSLHQQECIANLGYQEGDFPVSEQSAKEVLALPMYPELSASDQERVIETLNKFIKNSIRQFVELTPAD